MATPTAKNVSKYRTADPPMPSAKAPGGVSRRRQASRHTAASIISHVPGRNNGVGLRASFSVFSAISLGLSANMIADGSSRSRVHIVMFSLPKRNVHMKSARCMR